MRESKIEAYLHEQVTLAGGTTRKMKGRVNDPDRLVIWPRSKWTYFHDHAEVHFVETKATGKGARPGQKREHDRLRKLFCVVLVIDTKQKVDKYIESYRQ